MSSPFTLPPSVLRPINDLRSSNYSYVSALTILLYDYLLTFQQERITVWRSDWTIGKWLFLINRYFNIAVVSIDAITFLVPNPTLNLCRGWWGLQTNIGILLLGVVEVVLVLRTYALYGKKRYVGILLSVLVLMTIIYMFSFNNYFFSQMSFRVNPLPTVLTGCLPMVVCDSPQCFRLFKYYWIPMMVCDSVICGFTGFRAFQHARNAHRHRLVTVVLRDGLMYFALILGVTFTNVVLWASARPELMQILTDMTRVLVSVLCSRLLLNIRRVSTRTGVDSSGNGGTHGGPDGHDGMRFAVPHKPPYYNLEISHTSHTTSGSSSGVTSTHGDDNFTTTDIAMDDVKSPMWTPRSRQDEENPKSQIKWGLGNLKANLSRNNNQNGGRGASNAKPTQRSSDLFGSGVEHNIRPSNIPVQVDVPVRGHTRSSSGVKVDFNPVPARASSAASAATSDTTGSLHMSKGTRFGEEAYSEGTLIKMRSNSVPGIANDQMRGVAA